MQSVFPTIHNQSEGGVYEILKFLVFISRNLGNYV